MSRSPTALLQFEIRTVFPALLSHASSSIPDRTLLGLLSGIREARQVDFATACLK
jgi:hypothetical protein